MGKKIASFDRDFEVGKVGHVQLGISNILHRPAVRARIRTDASIHAQTHTSDQPLSSYESILRRGNKTFRVRGYNCRGRARAHGLYEASAARDGEGRRGVCSLGLGAPGGYRAPFFIL